jgi:phosphatidylcholine synthase
MTSAEVTISSPGRPQRRRARVVRRCLAWGVHGYTALGLVAAAGIAALIVRGDAVSFAWAFVLMLVATLIDATDGALARAVKVKEVLPGFSGTQLDNLIDFLTYTCLPLLLLWRADVLPADLGWCYLVPLVASAYGFSQVQAKTADGCFLGFPSLWNVVAFYVYVLQPPAAVALGILWILAVLTFVPSRYLYPSRGRGRINLLANLLGAAWAVLLVWILVRLVTRGAGDELTGWLTVASLSYPVYYLGASWLVSAEYWRDRRRRPPLAVSRERETASG